MNKNKVDELIPKAYDALKDAGIVEKGSINKAFRGQIATFGAAVTNGSLLSAIAFFSNDGSSEVTRSNLLKAIQILIPESTEKGLFDYVKSKGKAGERSAREDILNAAIAIKLAMNLYELEE